jgi:branched-chain amino acid transport system permease protein
VAQFKKFDRLWVPYAAVLVAGIVLFLGVTSMIELVYHYQLESAGGTTLKLYGFTADTATVTTWATAVIVTAIGAVLMTFVSRYFRRIWGGIQTEIQLQIERGLA